MRCLAVLLLLLLLLPLLLLLQELLLLLPLKPRWERFLVFRVTLARGTTSLSTSSSSNIFNFHRVCSSLPSTSCTNMRAAQGLFLIFPWCRYVQHWLLWLRHCWLGTRLSICT